MYHPRPHLRKGKSVARPSYLGRRGDGRYFIYGQHAPRFFRRRRVAFASQAPPFYRLPQPGAHLEAGQLLYPVARFLSGRSRSSGRWRRRVCPRTRQTTALFALIGYGFAQNSTGTFWLDLCVRELTAESLPVERHGARARDNFDVFELQRLAARGQQSGIFDLPAAAAILENHLRPRGLRKPIIAPLFKSQVGREKIATLLRQYIFVTPAMLRQRHACHHAEINELLQPRAENVWRNAKIVLKLVEPPGAIIGFPKQQDRPAVADHLHGAGDGAFLVERTRTLHGVSQSITSVNPDHL